MLLFPRLPTSIRTGRRTNWEGFSQSELIFARNSTSLCSSSKNVTPRKVTFVQELPQQAGNMLLALRSGME